MKRILLTLSFAASLVPLLAAAAELPSRRYQLPIDPGAQNVQTSVLNAEKALAEDAVADKGAPLRYAILHKVSVSVNDRSKQAVGRWMEVDAEFDLWRTRIDAPGALSIDLALAPFHLPEGAEVWLSDASGKFLRGPYTAADNPKFGEFWTPYVPGDVAYLEVLVPKALRSELQFGIKSVQQAYRSIESGESPFAKSGSCNVDVVCPEGNNYRDQINAVARYSVSGGLCTGQLVNNTAQDGKRYFLTANHCISSQADASSVVAYWKYENPTCRTPGSSQSGTPICTNPLDASCFAASSIVQTGGATLRSTYEPADTTLIEFNTDVPASANPFWLGWDRGSDVPTSAIGIHHPLGHEKRISFENNPLDSTDIDPPGVPGSKHWHVPGWDLGTTEQGSSGSVLMNPQKRLIGVLSGGAASCASNFDDYYGRLNVAWDGGGTSSSSVKSWLDPASSGVMTLDGRSTCSKPNVSLSLATANPTIDGDLTVQAAISGGTAPYTLNWDVDNNGQSDHYVPGVSGGSSLAMRFPSRRSATVALTVTDATGCNSNPVTLPVQIRGPQLTAAADGAASQFCGDGDANIEPGEIWNVPVNVTNQGDDAMNDGFALLTGGSVVGTSSGSSAASDLFGYRALSSSSSASCNYQPIDLSGAAALALTRGPHVGGSVSANDEGYAANLAVGGSAPFKFYGSDITHLMISTNGYLSTNVADGGDDYTAACGLDAHQGIIDGRIQVLHDDLVVQSGGSLKHQHFNTCPRPSDAGAASQGCTVFEWRNMGRYSNSGSASGNAVFQTILYDQSYEIVHQYVTADPVNGGAASIGLQSPDQSIRFDYRCDQANAAPAGTAVCFFHPSALPASLAEAKVHVVSQAHGLGNLGVGQNAGLGTMAYVDPAAQCGSRAVVSFLGGVDDYGYTMTPTKVLDVAMPAAGNCQVASQCAAQLTSLGAPSAAGGMYWNPNRSGNGQNIFNIGNIFSATWFTAEANRFPIWYLLVGSWNPSYSQAAANIQRFARTSNSPFTVAASTVGHSQMTRGDDDATYIHTWEIGGAYGGEKLSRVYPQNDLPTPNHTGGWANASESGWGAVVDEHRVGAQPSTGVVTYLYDQAGLARWSLGEQANTSNVVAQSMFAVHCPTCAQIPAFGASVVPIGPLTYHWTSQTTGTLDAALTLPSGIVGTWNRSGLPVQMITPPLSANP